ncbi:MAG TPA: IS630 family transposase [Geminicoccaceae bacterium]
MIRKVAIEHPEAERVELWFADEARVGQKGRVTHVWYQKGVRPRGVREHRFASAHLFGAVCPERDAGVALVLPEVSTRAMNLFLAELSRAVPAGTHAVLVLDRAGRHVSADLVVPPDLTLVRLPPYSPELNSVERVWLYLRERWLSHRVLAGGYEAVVDAACAAWNALRAEPGRLRSLTSYPWLPRSVQTSVSRYDMGWPLLGPARSHPAARAPPRDRRRGRRRGAQNRGRRVTQSGRYLRISPASSRRRIPQR